MTAKASAAPTAPTIIADAICTGCGCLCDDIALHVVDGRIVEAERACELGRTWLLHDSAADVGPIANVDGRPAELNTALDRAAHILRTAKYPLVYGLGDATTEAQRMAVAIADRLGGVLDVPGGDAHGPTGVTFQGVGEVTCTLGEVRNRGDLIVIWGADPVRNQPRLFEKYLEPAGQFVPRGRQDRFVVVIDVEPTATSAAADLFVKITPHRDFEALWTLRALAQGIALDAQQVECETGVSLAAWQSLIERMKQANFGIFLYGNGLTATRGNYLNAEALLALTRDLNAHTRFTARSLQGPGNETGAENVSTWQTGFPFGVNLAQGYPRFNPGEYTAEAVLTRGETDAALLFAVDPCEHLSAAAAARLAQIPTIVIDFRAANLKSAAVAIRTSTYGLHAPGTAYRMDDVPLPLRPAITSPYPSDAAVLEELLKRLTSVNG